MREWGQPKSTLESIYCGLYTFRVNHCGLFYFSGYVSAIVTGTRPNILLRDCSQWELTKLLERYIEKLNCSVQATIEQRHNQVLEASWSNSLLNRENKTKRGSVAAHSPSRTPHPPPPHAAAGTEKKKNILYTQGPNNKES